MVGSWQRTSYSNAQLHIKMESTPVEASRWSIVESAMLPSRLLVRLFLDRLRLRMKNLALRIAPRLGRYLDALRCSILIEQV